MTMDAEQLHPPAGEGPVATAHERRNIAGLVIVMNKLQLSLPSGDDDRRADRHVACAIR